MAAIHCVFNGHEFSRYHRVTVSLFHAPLRVIEVCGPRTRACRIDTRVDAWREGTESAGVRHGATEVNVSPIRFLSCVSLVALCAAAQDANKLPIKRVVLYKNGVGYFEHVGKVRDKQDVTIPFTSGQLNDVLKLSLIHI